MWKSLVCTCYNELVITPSRELQIQLCKIYWKANLIIFPTVYSLHVTFCLQSDYRLAKPESRIRKERLLDQTGFPVLSIRKTGFAWNICWNQPDFRLSSFGNPVSDAISTIHLLPLFRLSVSLFLTKSRLLLTWFHSKIHHSHSFSIQIDSYKLSTSILVSKIIFKIYFHYKTHK